MQHAWHCIAMPWLCRQCDWGIRRITEFQKSIWLNSAHSQPTHRLCLCWSSKEMEHYVKLHSSFISTPTAPQLEMDAVRMHSISFCLSFHFECGLVWFRIHVHCICSTKLQPEWHRSHAITHSHNIIESLELHEMFVCFRALVCLFARCYMRTEINWNK